MEITAEETVKAIMKIQKKKDLERLRETEAEVRNYTYNAISKSMRRKRQHERRV